MNDSVNKDRFREWDVEALRLTAFTNERLTPENITWWSDVVGEAPDSTESRPKEGIRNDLGIVDDASLKLTCQANRIDWIYSAIQESGSTERETLGKFNDSFPKFQSKMNKWLETSPELTRLAVGIILNKPVDDRRAGYHDLNLLLPDVNIDEDGSSDFVYRINRPRTSAVINENNFKVNRLSIWSVIYLRKLHVTLSGDDERLTNLSIPSPGNYGVRLELDLSSDQGNTVNIQRDKLEELFLELTNMGKEIASKGDIK